MARPQPTFTSDAMALNEQRDREHVRSLGEHTDTSDAVHDVTTDDLDAVTRAAGLLGGWRALHAEMVRTGRRLPSHRFVPASLRVQAQHSFEAGDRVPLQLRAWAFEYAPHLIDPDASGPPAQVSSPWW